jgi:hypothetical protein
MVTANNLTSNSAENTQALSPTLESEKFFIIAWGVLVAFFAILLLVVVQALGVNWGSGIFEKSCVTKLFKLVPFIGLSTLCSAILFYLLNFARVLTKLFQVFWASLEDEY